MIKEVHSAPAGLAAASKYTLLLALLILVALTGVYLLDTQPDVTIITDAVPADIDKSLAYLSGHPLVNGLVVEEAGFADPCGADILDCDLNVVVVEYADGNLGIRVSARAIGDLEVANMDMAHLLASSLPELSAAGLPAGTKVWAAHIWVHHSVRTVGAGRAMWAASDRIIYYVSRHMGHTGPIYRVFSDKSGWGPSLMRHVPADRIVWTNGKDIWIYTIGGW